MEILGGIFILLSLILSIASFIGLIYPKALSFSKTGKIHNRFLLFFGYGALSSIALLIGAAFIGDGLTQPTQNQAQEAKATNTTSISTNPAASESHPNTSEPIQTTQTTDDPQVTEPTQRAEFDFDFRTLNSRINVDLKAIESRYRIPTNVKLTGDKNDVNLISQVDFSDKLGFITSVSPQTKNVNSITVIYAPGGDTNLEILENIVTSSLIIAAADGDNGNQTVGNKIVSMTTEALKEFTDSNMQKTTNRSITFNNIEYSILLAKDMPMMFFATPK